MGEAEEIGGKPGAGVIAVLLLVKLAAKMIGVWSAAAAFRLPRRERTYTTLLMATGLTFGSIAALFGLTHHLIDRTQYTELVTVLILRVRADPDRPAALPAHRPRHRRRRGAQRRRPLDHPPPACNPPGHPEANRHPGA